MRTFEIEISDIAMSKMATFKMAIFQTTKYSNRTVKDEESLTKGVVVVTKGGLQWRIGIMDTWMDMDIS